jgi:hypothetical protein
MDRRTVALLTDLARVNEAAQARAGLGAAQAETWRSAARLALGVLLGAALVAAPVEFWAAWLRGR